MGNGELEGMNTSTGKCKSTTHFACKERLDEYGGKTLGCCCVGHECTPPEESTLDNLKQLLGFAIAHGTYMDEEAREAEFENLLKLIQERERLARIDELNSWFDLPEHYPGEEYRDEPFAKVKCKLPNKIQYYRLDSGFTYAIKNRLNQLRNTP